MQINVFIKKVFIFSVFQLGCSVAMVLMMIMRHDHIALYLGTVIFGLFLSSATPTALSLAEHYIDFSGKDPLIMFVLAFNIMIYVASI